MQVSVVPATPNNTRQLGSWHLSCTTLSSAIWLHCLLLRLQQIWWWKVLAIHQNACGGRCNNNLYSRTIQVHSMYKELGATNSPTTPWSRVFRSRLSWKKYQLLQVWEYCVWMWFPRWGVTIVNLHPYRAFLESNMDSIAVRYSVNYCKLHLKWTEVIVLCYWGQ